MDKHSRKLIYPFLLLALAACSKGQTLTTVNGSTPNQNQSTGDGNNGSGGNGGSGGGVVSPTEFTTKIKAVTTNSTCAKYSWKNRGRAPAGYIDGVALTYARSLCRYKSTARAQGLAGILSAPESNDDAHDALTHYDSIFNSLQIRTDGIDTEALRAIYTLGTGLGMRESSGRYCVGWDTTVSSPTASGAEAGPFQTSYDSMGANPELSKLYQEYLANPNRCHLDVFKVGATCSAQSIVGSGAGASYQIFNKICPAFATEYAMTLLRILRKHFGPINRLEAEVIPSCETMFRSVEAIVDADPEHACHELF